MRHQLKEEVEEEKSNVRDVSFICESYTRLGKTVRKDATLKGKGSDNSMRSLKNAVSPPEITLDSCKHWAT